MSRKQADLVFSVAILLLLIGMVWIAKDWPARSRLFPFTIGIPAILLALLQVFFGVRRLREGPLVQSGETLTAATERPASAGGSQRGVETAIEELLAATESTLALSATDIRLRAIQMCSWLLLFAAGAAFLGFRLGSALLTLAFLRTTAREPWRMSLAVAFGTYVVFAFFFDFALAVHLPPGIISDWLDAPSLDAYMIGLIISR